MVIVSDFIIITTLQAITGVGGQYAGGKVMLFTNNIVPTKATVLADLTEATFGGYARTTLAGWTAPYVNMAGNYSIDNLDIQEFDGDGSGPDEAIMGYGVLNAGGTVLLQAEKFATPIQVSGGNVHLGILVRISNMALNGSGLVSA